MRKLNFLVGFGAMVMFIAVVIGAVHLMMMFLSVKVFALTFIGVLIGIMIFLLRDMFEDIGEDVVWFIKERLNGKKDK